MIFRQKFRITGSANSTVFDAGLKSTTSEKKKLLRVHLQADKHAGTDDNNVQGWLEKVKVLDIPEKMVPDQLTADTTADASGNQMQAHDIMHEIPEGEIFKAAMQCAATAVNLRGYYEYEIV